jgi:hypothetical protein
LLGIAYIAGCLGRKTRALEAATQAVAWARSAHDPRILAQALRQYAVEAMLLRYFSEAETALAEAEAFPRPSAAERLLLLDTRALLSGHQGNAAAAVRATERLLRDYQALGNAAAVRYTTIVLAEFTHAMGETARAIDLLRGALPEFRASGDRNMLVNGMANFASYLAAVDQFGEARAAARELIAELGQREPTHAWIAVALEPLALALAHDADLHRAATLEGYAEAAFRAQGFTREFTETTTHDRLMTLLAERLAPGELEHWLAKGARLTAEGAVELALR